MRKGWLLFVTGWALIMAGSWLAAAVQTSGGISVRDVRFAGGHGVQMSGLLYVPANATRQTPAPAILAVHGYINSRETQSGFAIEFARRGYVVLAIDQTGHGYSGGAAFSDGFGGPASLAYLQSLAGVDKANIGLEGHSMGGWAVLAAAAAMPDAYKAMVLEGSSTGKPFAAEATATWPRNLAVVFSRHDEFSTIMWGVERARDVVGSAKLKAAFGTSNEIVPGRIYGIIGNGTARRLTTPWTTHPGDHISTVAIGDSLDWFGRTLVGGMPRPVSDQIWYWKDIGTGVALGGFVLLLLGSFDVLLGLGFAGLRTVPPPVEARRDGDWWRRLAATAVVPTLSFFPAFMLVTAMLPPSRLLPQTVTTQVLAWAAVNTAITLALEWRRHRRQPALFGQHPVQFGAIALGTIGIGYGALFVADWAFKVDFRFWVIALKLFNRDQFAIALVYLLPLTGCYLVALRSLHDWLAVAKDRPATHYVSGIAAMALGFLVLLALDYGVFFATGTLPTAFDPLSTVIAIQFVPLLTMVAVIGVFTWRRTGSHVPGALLCGLLVTWYIVAGTATQVV